MLDCVIVGGGPAGAIAGLVLARAGARVRIVDRAAFPRDKGIAPGRGDWRYAVIARVSTVTSPPCPPLLWGHPKET